MWSLFRLLTLAVCATSLPTDSRAVSPASSLAVRQSDSLPSSFEWTSSGVLVGPKNDGRGANNVKDPSIVYYDGRYHVFATVFTTGYTLITFSFTDFADANTAPFTYLADTPLGPGYRAAPQVFYFAPQQLWYLVYQNGNAAYSTNPDINDPTGWSAPTNFFTQQPAIITENIGDGFWVDMWVICDDETCHLFSSDDNGQLYRSSTPLADFPDGFGDGANTVIALSDPNRFNLFEASNVYKISGDTYLLIVEAIGTAGRFFRSWTSSALDGEWTPLADTEANPFAGQQNVDFPEGAWTQSISHGEAVREDVDQNMNLSPCGLRYLYQGLDPNADGGDYNSQPWRLGLLTQSNSVC